MNAPPNIPDHGNEIDITHLIDTGAPGTWANALLHSPCLNQSEYRPHAPFTPTLASGGNGQPPEGTSDGGDHRLIAALRMAGTGELQPKIKD